jgi:hypothetical protein
MAHYKRRSRRSDSNYDLSWSSTNRERKLPIEDGVCNGKKRSSRACKRSKDGVHVIEYRSRPISWVRGADGYMRSVYDYRVPYNKYGWFCVNCGKRFWIEPRHKARRKERVTTIRSFPKIDEAKKLAEVYADHWSEINIWYRLRGHECQCGCT